MKHQSEKKRKEVGDENRKKKKEKKYEMENVFMQTFNYYIAYTGKPNKITIALCILHIC